MWMTRQGGRGERRGGQLRIWSGSSRFFLGGQGMADNTSVTGDGVGHVDEGNEGMLNWMAKGGFLLWRTRDTPRCSQSASAKSKWCLTRNA